MVALVNLGLATSKSRIFKIRDLEVARPKTN